MTNQPITVWTEVPVTDMERAVTFYNTVFGYEMAIDTTGPNPMAVFGNNMNTVGGHLYPGTPGTAGNGPTVHLALPDTLEAGIERCTKAGGQVISPAIEIPPGRFAYAIDPDGNSLGLFEPKAA